MLPYLVRRKDILVSSCSQIGEIAAISIGALHLIDVKNPECQAIILVPTTEDAYLIDGMISDLLKVDKEECSEDEVENNERRELS